MNCGALNRLLLHEAVDPNTGQRVEGRLQSRNIGPSEKAGCAGNLSIRLRR
jgi:hypothetical protein